MELLRELDGRMSMGKEKYGHGVRIDDDTTTWGTKTDSWMDMANEEFLDAIIYIVADYIRQRRTPIMGKMEIEYMLSRPGFMEAKNNEKWIEDNPLEDDNELIRYIIRHWRDMEPCRHKTLLCSLMNILRLDQYPSMASQSGLVPDCDSSDSDSETSLSSFGELQLPF